MFLASVQMAKEHFFHRATPPLFKKLEHLSQRSSVSRGQAFEDWLTAMVCALAAETKEAEYLSMVERHKTGKPGSRGIELIAEMFGELVNAMSESDADILGDLYQGAITYGEAGQYFTPENLAKLLAQMTIDPNDRAPQDKAPMVNDPCCGTGRLLLEASNLNPSAELVGQDIDPRCAKITAINLALRGRYGWVICGNSLSGETSFAFRIGSFYNETPAGIRRGVIRDAQPNHAPHLQLMVGPLKGVASLFDGTTTAITPGSPRPPTIVEVPRWLSRLELSLEASDKRSRTEAERSTSEPSFEACDGTRHQKMLF